jgi:NTE family protein
VQESVVQPSAPAVLQAGQRPPFECIALLLQGGGALGAYQAGVHEAMTERGLVADWVAGISIGAINAAIIAGNPPQETVGKLRKFWETITASPLHPAFDLLRLMGVKGDHGRSAINQANATFVLVNGAPGFFRPRVPSPLLQPPGSVEATSFYDTSQLRGTLEALVDFDRLNAGPMRCSVGATNVRSGNFVYFDTRRTRLRPEHIMASGALPPGFPAVEIDGEDYWDGGIVSNTPLQWVLESAPRQDTLAFQVDLWSARGDFPRDIAEVSVRLKEIQYSSRTRAATDGFRTAQKLRRAISALLDAVPGDAPLPPEVDLLREFSDQKVYNIVQLIYRSKHYEGDSKDYEFSRRTMEEHWRSGYQDATRALRHRRVFQRPDNMEGVVTFDLQRDGHD